MKTEKYRTIVQSIFRAVATNWFFRIVLGIFVVQALFVALTGAYSMAFDEYYHLGIIKIYAQQWSPLLGSQPEGEALYGALARDPSYLYHFLMSFPYRLFAQVTDNQVAHTIFLRAIDVAIFTTGIIVWRKVVQRAGFSPVATNVLMLLFVLIPVASFTAGQLNYDNLLFLASAVSVYLTLRVTQVIRETKRIPLRDSLLLLSVLFLSSLVKYAFLPVLLGIAIYVVAILIRTYRRPLRFLRACKQQLPSLRSLGGVMVSILFVISFGLFMERYAVNTIQYHSPAPDCDAVISLEACRSYAPFDRNQKYKEQDLQSQLDVVDKISYLEIWPRQMGRELYFTVGPREADYPAGAPLKVAYVTAWVVFWVAVVCVLVRAKALWRSGPAIRLFIVISGVYVSVLFIQNLSEYLGLGIPVAIHGRYLFPVLIPMLCIMLLAMQQVFRRVSVGYKFAAVTLVVLLTLNGGGVLPYIIRSADSWMWQNQTVLQVTRGVRSVLWPVVTQ